VAAARVAGWEKITHGEGGHRWEANKPQMAELRDVWGNSTSLTDERRAHLMEHPEMRGQEDKIDQTLLEPDTMIRSQSDDTIRLFYRFTGGLASAINISA
jgi:hypothetical protein